jgi:histidine kinase
LINNAVHYTEKGKIVLEVKRKDNDILFSVSDTGVGIPKEHLEKIFERFYQVDSHLTRKIGGTGLGLSLCKGFVEAMGGKIWVESEVGKGSTFYFTLPIEKQKIMRKEIKIFKNAA